MTIREFDEAERFLIEEWRKVRDLRNCIEEMEEKQKSRMEEIGQRVLQSKLGLDRHTLFPKKGSPKRSIWIKKEQWPGELTGLWIENISLKLLLDEDDAPPWGSVYFDLDDGPSLEMLKERIWAARDLTSQPQSVDWKKGGDPKAAIYFDLPETGDTLVKMLLENNGESFNKCIIEHFNFLGRFIPTIDKVLAELENKQ